MLEFKTPPKPPVASRITRWFCCESKATMLKQMVNVSSAELEGWSEQVERLQIRKQDRSGWPWTGLVVGGFLGDQRGIELPKPSP